MNQINKTKGPEMKKTGMVIYKLFVDNTLDIIHYNKASIEARKNEILKQWVDGNKYVFSNWTNKNKPQFKVEGGE